jgi:UDP-N-acetylmuramate dehydrogenase
VSSVPTGSSLAAAAGVLGARAARDASLAPLTTYRAGGPAALLVADAGPDDLRAVARAVEASGLPVLVVGRGSNLLVADRGFPGIVVTLGEALATVEVDATSVVAGGGAALPVVARRTAGAGLTGFEWAVGVPGSIGGAVRMNAGGHGSDMAAVLTGVHVLDLGTGEDGWVPVDDLQLAYRRSSLRSSQVVVSAHLALALGDREASEAEIASIVRWRRANQPGGANAGSVFANPGARSAGELVDASGLKGHRRGSAHVSTKHANFIQVDEDGSADDVAALMAEVRAIVLERTGETLHAETRLVGFPAEVVRAAGADLDDPSLDPGPTAP